MFHYFIVALKCYLVFAACISTILLFVASIYAFKDVFERKHWADIVPAILMLSAAIAMGWGTPLLIQCWFDVNMPQWLWLQY